MTVPPLPASPCMRVRLIYTNADGSLAGSRFYLSYAGAAPTPGDCTAIASSIEAAWDAHVASLIFATYAITEIDVIDIATTTGSSGQWTGNVAGTRGGTMIPASIATNVEFLIARRYRGGKPRMFWPPAGEGDLADGGHWTAAFVTEATDGTRDFFTAVEAIAQGAVGQLAHVNLSYYYLFTNVTNSSGRTRAAPKYRPAALLDTIEGYAAKAEVGSQRRRRIATSP